MLFVEPRFLPFFLVAFGIYWLARGQDTRKAWLLICSYAFYAAWDYRFLSLIFVSTAVDFCVGLGLARTDNPAQRKRLVITSLAVNLGILGVFKYFDFFAGSLAELLGLLGVPVNRTTLEIVLPLGISFYTFQTLSYSLDLYRRRIEVCRKPLDFALFVAFFPQLVAGPIVRAGNFLPQLQRRAELRDVQIRSCLVLFFVGFFKKACISDNLSPYVDAYFASPGAFDAPSGALAVVLYSIQIYCDFSGYSDMAIACAGLLGFQIPKNFDFPYFATDIAGFWRRWHISLSSWMRDYVYIPLGGSRCGALLTSRNLFLTMVISGLWHGAAWNFVVWGCFHGAGIILHRALPTGTTNPSFAVRGMKWLGTYAFVLVGWVLFRSADLATSGQILADVLFLSGGGGAHLHSGLWLLPAGLAGLHALARRGAGRRAFVSLPPAVFALVYGAAFGIAITLANASYQPFIYFQF